MSACAMYKYSKSDGSIYYIYWYKVHWVQIILYTHAKVVYTCDEAAIISLGVDHQFHTMIIVVWMIIELMTNGPKKTNRYICTHHKRYVHTKRALCQTSVP